jgi:hypothetical protein
MPRLEKYQIRRTRGNGLGSFAQKRLVNASYAACVAIGISRSTDDIFSASNAVKN